MRIGEKYTDVTFGLTWECMEKGNGYAVLQNQPPLGAKITVTEGESSGRLKFIHKDKTDMDQELLWNLLKDHIGHRVEIAAYGDPEDPADICLEDLDTGTVILDAELYTLAERAHSC